MYSSRIGRISSWLRGSKSEDDNSEKLQREAEKQLEILNDNVTDEELLNQVQPNHHQTLSLQNSSDSYMTGNNSFAEDVDCNKVPLVIEAEPIPEGHPDFCEYILSKQMMEKIANYYLPSSIKFNRWKRFYNLTRDGDSFETFLKRVKGQQRTLLVVKTTRGDIFGAFADSEWSGSTPIVGNSNASSAYYGSAQAFLFKIIIQPSSPTQTIKLFKWSGLNRYIQLCDTLNKRLIMGGGGNDDSHGFGLCVEGDFVRGSSRRCETFQNEILTSSSNTDINADDDSLFDVLDFEAWGFTTYKF